VRRKLSHRKKEPFLGGVVLIMKTDLGKRAWEKVPEKRGGALNQKEQAS